MAGATVQAGLNRLRETLYTLVYSNFCCISLENNLLNFSNFNLILINYIYEEQKEAANNKRAQRDEDLTEIGLRFL